MFNFWYISYGSKLITLTLTKIYYMKYRYHQRNNKTTYKYIKDILLTNQEEVSLYLPTNKIRVIQLPLGHLLYIILDPIKYYNTDKKQIQYHIQHLSYYRLRASHLYQVGSITHLNLSEGNRPLENPGF